MKSKDLIARLQALSPDGEMEVNCGEGIETFDIIAIELCGSNEYEGYTEKLHLKGGGKIVNQERIHLYGQSVFTLAKQEQDFNVQIEGFDTLQTERLKSAVAHHTRQGEEIRRKVVMDIWGVYLEKRAKREFPGFNTQYVAYDSIAWFNTFGISHRDNFKCVVGGKSIAEQREAVWDKDFHLSLVDNQLKLSRRVPGGMETAGIE